MRSTLATVNLCVSVPESMGPGSWRWTLAEDNPVGEVAAYRAADLEEALPAYGTVVGQGTFARRFDRFRLTAHGRLTGRVLGELHYRWHAKARMFVPAAPPVVLWPRPEDLPPELRGLVTGPHASPEAPWWERGVTAPSACSGGSQGG